MIDGSMPAWALARAAITFWTLGPITFHSSLVAWMRAWTSVRPWDCPMPGNPPGNAPGPPGPGGIWASTATAAIVAQAVPISNVFFLNTLGSFRMIRFLSIPGSS